MSNESDSPLNSALSAAIDNPSGFDFGFTDERRDENFANFGVSEDAHREIFAKFNEPYPGDEDISLDYRPEEIGDVW